MNRLAIALAAGALALGLSSCSGTVENGEFGFLKVQDKEIGEVMLAKTAYTEPEPEPEPVYYYEEPVYYGSSYDNDFKSQGVVYDGDTRYTWYSQNVLPGGGLTELNNNGRHVDESTGFIMDGDGYIAVASNDHAQGEIVDTPWGPGKVYDSGCSSGTIDIYTDF